MIKWIKKATIEYVVLTKEDVDNLEEELRADAMKNNYQLTGYSWVEKEIKENKEVVDSYFEVKATSIMNNPKEPDNPIRLEFYLPEVPEEAMEGF